MPAWTQPAAPDTEELARFREKWKQEILGKVQQHSQPGPSETHPTAAQHAPQAFASSLKLRLQSALDTYSLAVSREQSGNHSEATRLYRYAFRLDQNVDKAYRRDELTRDRKSSILAGSSLPNNQAKLPMVEKEPPKTNHVPITRETLPSLFKSWPQSLSFAPESEARGVPINKLPDELIVFILYTLARNTDVNAIERFAVVSRRARILSLDSMIWRKLVQLEIVPPQLAGQDIPLRKLAERYFSDYRRIYVEHPRLRFDGAYISICHYVRNGLGDNAWVNVSHLVTYRRFLRFLPNGEVLSYRANEDQEIGDIIHALQPGLRRKDLCVGEWRLMGTTVLVSNLVDRTRSGRTGGDSYNFQMSLTLKSRPSLGRWNKLDLLGYESVNLNTGETASLPLRHERPFWFSRVRSY